MAEKKTCKGKAPKKAPAPKPKPEAKPAPKVPNKKEAKALVSAFKKASETYIKSLSGLFDALALRGDLPAKMAQKNLENAKGFDSKLTEWLKDKGY